MPRLGPEELARLPAEVRRPAYDRSKLRTGILHLGLGAFHRGHQAAYTDAILADDPRWGIAGVSMHSAEVRDRLLPQRGLYTLLERDGDDAQVRVCGAIAHALHLPTQLGDIVRLFAHPEVRIVTLTVTEKGYCHDPATRTLNLDHPGIVADLADPQAPRAAIGLLAAGLGTRERVGGTPLTVISCDNLPQNGRMLEGLVREYAGRVDPKLAAWVDRNVAFPCTMVDRIVPATTPADLDEVARRIGRRDEAAVVCEPFSQWVIEDRFAGPRPAWEQAGVQVVADAAPYEAMKLRLLNASHSTIVYLGLLAGYEYMADVMRAPAFANLARRLMREDAGPTLAVPADMDLDDYAERIVRRVSNRALGHTCAQVAMDGSQKLPQRLLATARARLAAGASCDHVVLAVAGWIRYVAGVDEQGRRHAVDDPLAARLAAAAGAAGPEAGALARRMLGVREVFGEDLPQAPRFVDAVAASLATLQRLGARRAVEAAYG